jgi:hypothetical protein
MIRPGLSTSLSVTKAMIGVLLCRFRADRDAKSLMWRICERVVQEERNENIDDIQYDMINLSFPRKRESNLLLKVQSSSLSDLSRGQD